MRSIPELAKGVACALIGAAALGFASTAAAQAPAPAASPPAASPSAESTEAAEPSRRERRRAQEPAPAPATDATAAQPPAAKTAEPELVCKSVRPAGTRLPQRVCHTQADWDSLTEASQEDMRRVRDRSRASGARPN